MNKRYQVFISSTFSDLEDERKSVMQTLMEMDCIPAGMELFPAQDEEQLNFIKKIIDDCDYYILIIGGRYGSLTPEGISYTEQEFDYAIEKGIKVIALLHGSPESLMVSQTDNNSKYAELLATFRDKVQTGRLVKYWNSAKELQGLVALSLMKTIKAYPALGWVRGSTNSSTDLLEQINSLRLENESLRSEIATHSKTAVSVIPDVADLDVFVTLTGTYRFDQYSKWPNWNLSLSWRDLFSMISPYLLTNPPDNEIRNIIAKSAYQFTSGQSKNATIDDQIFQTIKIQFQSLGFIDLILASNSIGAPLLWSLTRVGKGKMIELRTIRNEN